MVAHTATGRAFTAYGLLLRLLLVCVISPALGQLTKPTLGAGRKLLQEDASTVHGGEGGGDDGEGGDDGPQPPLPPFMESPPSPPQPTADIQRSIGEYEVIGQSMVVAVHMLALPGTDQFFMMERPSGYHPDQSWNIAGFFDVPSGQWTHLGSPDGLFCSGHTFLSNGTLLVVGGHKTNSRWPDGMKSVRVYDRGINPDRLVKVNELGWKRWYPTPTLLPDGQVMIIGGTQGVGAGTGRNKMWELYNPSNNSLTSFEVSKTYFNQGKQLYYPFQYVLPFTGDLFTFSGRHGWIMDWRTNKWHTEVARLRGYPNTQYPFTGSSVLLGLYPENNYTVEVMLFGGTNEDTVYKPKKKASNASGRLSLPFDGTKGKYNASHGWQMESMAFPRVMPDSVMLPNGRVIVMNGAEVGLAGDSANGGESRAHYPVFHAEMYNPDAAKGERWTTLAASRIARMYHSTACLTTNGTIIVAGCDRCRRFDVSPNTNWSPSPTSKAEYRLEIFSPPFVFYPEQRPNIVSVQADAMHYGEEFDIGYSMPTEGLSITRVVLVAPCSCTHSFNTHQRLVGLEIISTQASTDTFGTVRVRGPPDEYIAVPGPYMLFILNGDYYSTAQWVTLKRA